MHVRFSASRRLALRPAGSQDAWALLSGAGSTTCVAAKLYMNLLNVRIGMASHMWVAPEFQAYWILLTMV
jgi:hypothetical protein